MPVFKFAFIPFSQMTANAGNPLTTTSTTGTSGSFTPDAGASPFSIDVRDNDSNFDDAFIDPGRSQVLRSGVTVNGQFFGRGSVVELEFSVTTTGGDVFNYVRIDGVNVGLSGDTLPQSGTTYTIASSADGQSTPYAGLACFTMGTLIDTAIGARAIETLRVGDLVCTHDDGVQPLRWIGHRTLSCNALRNDPALRPVLIRAGALNNTGDILVSPQHRILIGGWKAEVYFGENPVLVPAKGLVNNTSICLEAPNAPVTYFHLLFDRHQLLISDGLISESLLPGDPAMMGIAPESVAEVTRLFPELSNVGGDADRTRYPVVKVQDALRVGWAQWP